MEIRVLQYFLAVAQEENIRQKAFYSWKAKNNPYRRRNVASTKSSRNYSVSRKD